MGSPFWSAPEVWARNYDVRGDDWSLGVVLLVLCRGMLTGDEVRQLHAQGVEGLLELQEKYLGRALPPPDLRALLGSLLKPEGARATAADALSASWLTTSGDRPLSNPAAAALRLRATERTARVVLPRGNASRCLRDARFAERACS